MNNTMVCQAAQTCLTLLHVLQGLRKLVSPDFEINMHYLKEVNRSVLDSTYHTWRLWYTDRGSTLFHAKEYSLPDSSISLSPRIARPTDLQRKNDVCYSPLCSHAASEHILLNSSPNILH